MNKQRKVLITITYNELGIITDTKAEEVTRIETNCSEIPNSSDAVSRQAAIDALEKQMPTPYTPDGSHPADEQIFQAQEVYADCITTLKSLPPIQPERAEGEWVQIQRCTGDAQPDLECPFCKHRIGWFDMGRYCAGCGAKLKGGAG